MRFIVYCVKKFYGIMGLICQNRLIYMEVTHSLVILVRCILQVVTVNHSEFKRKGQRHKAQETYLHTQKTYTNTRTHSPLSESLYPSWLSFSNVLILILFLSCCFCFYSNRMGFLYFAKDIKYCPLIYPSRCVPLVCVMNGKRDE